MNHISRPSNILFWLFTFLLVFHDFLLLGAAAAIATLA